MACVPFPLSRLQATAPLPCRPSRGYPTSLAVEKGANPPVQVAVWIPRAADGGNKDGSAHH